MKNNIIQFCLALIVLTTFASCNKQDDAGLPPYTLQVTLFGNAPKSITGDMTALPKDTLTLEYDVKCASEMKYVTIQKNGTDFLKDTLNGAVTKSFTSTKKIILDSICGVYTFRIMAKDVNGVFLGDKNVTVTITPDFTYQTAKTLFVPDSTDRKNQTYYSVANAKAYSFLDVNAAAANSANIDFGFFYDTTTVGTPKHTLYALNANKFLPYDISTWTKNATIFKRVASGNLTSFTSAGEIKKQCITNLASGATNSITTLVANNLIYFKTAAGRYGVMQVLYVNGTTASPTTSMNFEIKLAN